MARVLVRMGAGEDYPAGAEVVVVSAKAAEALFPHSTVVREVRDDEFGGVEAIAWEEPASEPAGDDAPAPRRSRRRRNEG